MAFLQCFTWIAHLLDCFAGQEEAARSLPDDLMIDILTRLPAGRIVQCRRVCKEWYNLTYSDYFVKLHHERASPQILIESFWYSLKRRYFVVGEELRKRRLPKKVPINFKLMPRLRRLRPPTVTGSYAGLLVFSHPGYVTDYYVCNPVTQEYAYVIPPQSSMLCGLFFDSKRNEFRLLFRDYMGQYHIYTLRTKTWRNASCPRLPCIPQCFSGYCAIPAIVNRSLHWVAERHTEYDATSTPCQNAILIFRMDSEDFTTMSHPGGDCKYYEVEHPLMRLVIKDACLSFILLRYPKMLKFDVWILESYAERKWVKQYRVSLDMDVRKYPVEAPIPPPTSISRVKILQIHKGELWFDWPDRGLFVYHLELSILTQIDRTKMRSPIFLTLPYRESLVKCVE